MKTMQLDIPMGFELKEERLVLTAQQARGLLLERICTKALKVQDRVELVRHYIVCPHCGGISYVYNKELGGFSGRMIRKNECVTEEKILCWLSLSLDLFDNQQEPLVLYHLSAPDFDLTCTKCKNRVPHTNLTKSVSLESRRHKVFVRTKVQSLDELLSLSFAKRGDVELELPLYETMCFNFRNGHTYLSVENEKGECQAVRDITHTKNICEDGAVLSAVNSSYMLRKSIKGMFEAQWGGELPFGACELGAEELRMLTAFMGYNRDFYAAIPYVNNTLRVDSEFASEARRMHKAKNAVSMLEESLLPCVKSVRRRFFKNQGLLFYIKECEGLWELLKDINLFTSLLADRGIFHILYELHCRPALFEFLQDFVRLKGVRALLRMIMASCKSFCRYGVSYVSMSPSMRLKEQSKWKSGFLCSMVGDHPYFTIPLCKPDCRIPNCTIDGFRFSWLTTTWDYQHAGDVLRNCLTDWTYTGHPVVCVSKEGRIVGAIEVRDKMVYQAHSFDNEELSEVKGLKEAYDKWCDKNDLFVFNLSEFDEDFFDDILF